MFLADEDWTATLRGIRTALRPGGHLVFETRRPEARAWESWHGSVRVLDVPGIGEVEELREVTEVALPLVSFRLRYTFRSDGTVLASDSTIRFRSQDEVTASLRANGYHVQDVRDAPDRPGREFVFIAG